MTDENEQTENPEQDPLRPSLFDVHPGGSQTHPNQVSFDFFSEEAEAGGDVDASDSGVQTAAAPTESADAGEAADLQGAVHPAEAPGYVEIEPEPETDGEPESETSSLAPGPEAESVTAEPDEATEPSNDAEAITDFRDIETPEELRPFASGSEGPAPRATLSGPLPPALDRQRPERPPLVPNWIWLSIAIALGVAALGVAAWIMILASLRVTVPTVAGESLGVARTRLAQAGLEARVTERRFSTEPVGEVLEQRPGAGVTLSRGDEVSLVVSAGTEEIVMPDVVGDGVALARGLLEERGLEVEIETVTTSEAASDTVLATTPAAGSIVRTGDVVRIQIASPRPDGQGVQPYRLPNVSVTIDPAPVPADRKDITLEVARRLRSLLEASGAQVTVVRSETSTGTSTAERSTAVRQSSPSVVVGLSVLPSGESGRVVLTPSQATTPSAQTVALSASLARELQVLVPPAREDSVTADPVLGDVTVPWARVRLGSFGEAADRSAFADPRWADRVARAIYTSLGEVFGTKEEL